MNLPRWRQRRSTPLVWNADKPHRCPSCHTVAIDVGRPRRLTVYTCCRCGARFTCWPKIAALLPDSGVVCSEHREVSD